MKTNNFSVKEKKEKRIVLEEERTKNPLLLFFRRYKNFFMLFLISLLVCMLLASVGIAFLNVTSSNNTKVMQMDLFNSFDLEKEKDENKITDTILDIKNKYGKNSILRGIDLVDGATKVDRNNQIGGHHA